ncbi:PA2778 family cysteine peptidase [Marinobacter nauticus]|uniref:Peptidase C39-like domain-containing protein n=1 Tax=Marinobacter nauticus TaxID=2743 RepID=A0A833JP55_MARNT|nr:PA2778 family cysteine peptidase [Marinobacter nauticus]KAE8544743.1 hypothetical protein F6453_2985 [Marinobacter nauticus]
MQQMNSRLKLTMAVALTAIVLLAGCASTPDWPVSARDNTKPVYSEKLLEQVPFYPQEKYQCGPASLAMMLNAQGLATNPDILKELVYLPGKEGSLQVELVAGARAHDMLVYRLEPEPEAILAEVEAGNPVLVMQNLRLSWWPQWHFAVVVGYDSTEQVFILNTDTRRHYEMPYKVFYNTWSKAERWAAVILPPDQTPASAEMLPYLQAAHDLETTGHTLAAQRAYQTAITRWPEQPTPLMANANLQYQLGHFQNAVGSFLRVVEKFPGFSEGWNNLAIALNDAGCPARARQASECAAGLAPKRFKPLQDETRSHAADAAACPQIPACPSNAH